MSRHAAATSEEYSGYETYGDIEVFGRSAVVAEQDAALAGLRRAQLADMGQYGEAFQEYDKGNGYLAEVQTELNNARQRLGDLSPSVKDELEPYFSKHAKSLPADHAGYSTWADWLSDGDLGATNEQLFNLIESHISYIMRQQRSPEFNNAVAEGRAKVINGIQRAVAEGAFSDHALQKIPDVMNIPVYVGDLLDNTLQLGASGFYSQGVIVIAQARHSAIDAPDEAGRELRANAKVTLPHEMDHPIFGRWEARWMREPLAEHNALSYEDGMFYAMRPGLHDEGKDKAYGPERELIAVLCEETPGAMVSIGKVTRAHTSVGPESAEWKQLMNAWDKAWNTVDMYAQVTERIDQLTEHVSDANQNWSYRQCQAKAIEQVIHELRNDRAIVKQAPLKALVHGS
jgi:hypothetical protein